MEIANIIAGAVILIVAALFIGWKIYKGGLRKTAIDLIVRVEEELEDNREKFDTVVNGLIMKLPFPLNIIITTSTIENFVQATFDEIKKALDYQKEIKSEG